MMSSAVIHIKASTHNLTEIGIDDCDVGERNCLQKMLVMKSQIKHTVI